MSARQRRDEELGPALKTIWRKNYSVYGQRKLTKAARRRGLDCGRDQVERLMKRQGIHGASRAKKRFTTHADSSHLRAPGLVNRAFVATRPDQLWVADFTYCSTWSGAVYVAFIIDVFSRQFVGWKASRAMTASLVVDSLNMAAWTRHTRLDGLICHTDAGAQFTGETCTSVLLDNGVKISIDGVGGAIDNVFIERLGARSNTTTSTRTPPKMGPHVAPESPSSCITTTKIGHTRHSPTTLPTRSTIRDATTSEPPEFVTTCSPLKNKVRLSK